MGQTKRTGLRVKNIYKLEVDGFTAMVGKEEEVVSRDEGELCTGYWAIFTMAP